MSMLRSRWVDTWKVAVDRSKEAKSILVVRGDHKKKSLLLESCRQFHPIIIEVKQLGAYIMIKIKKAFIQPRSKKRDRCIRTTTGRSVDT